MENSKISWTDNTWNPWEGCTKVSPGCTNCYAEARNNRFSNGSNWGKGKPRRRTSEANWKQPLKWNKHAAWFSHECIGCGKLFPSQSFSCCGEGIFQRRRPRVFCASLADWLDDEVPIEWLVDLLDLIRETPNLNWQLLTKRPQNWQTRIGEAHESICRMTYIDHDLAHWVECWKDEMPPANVWLGTTVEDQDRANLRLPQILAIPARVRFLSCEPLLGPLDLTPWLPIPERVYGRQVAGLGISWVIAGGESGGGARPMNSAWARSLRDQCQAAGVAFHFKQWGEWVPTAEVGFADSPNARTHTWPTGESIKTFGGPVPFAIEARRVGKKAAGRTLDGREWNEFPNL